MTITGYWWAYNRNRWCVLQQNQPIIVICLHRNQRCWSDTYHSYGSKHHVCCDLIYAENQEYVDFYQTNLIVFFVLWHGYVELYQNNDKEGKQIILINLHIVWQDRCRKSGICFFQAIFFSIANFWRYMYIFEIENDAYWLWLSLESYTIMYQPGTWYGKSGMTNILLFTKKTNV